VKNDTRKGSVAIVLARSTNEKIAINNGDITSMLSSIQSLQNQISNLSSSLNTISRDMAGLTNAIATTNDNATALSVSISTANANIEALSSTYNAHTHVYTDIDNLATALNKTTSTPQ
jgi:peptidoglycan hydrolase CwlO-like protein